MEFKLIQYIPLPNPFTYLAKRDIILNIIKLLI